MKIEKYQPGTFIELDDMAGGRRVAMVCKDGVTYWDLLDATNCTPLSIHPSLNPAALGTLVEFARRHEQEKALQTLVEVMRIACDERLNSDPLFVMRALWFIARKANEEGFELDAVTLGWAFEQAQIQGQAASGIHQFAERYCSL
ncbi:UNVERIFIED_ORG: hypothetical protein J2W65_002688 [Pseudomonas parafulva]|jgi:hypothetical protein|uniref:hypothetical protein n=1 Tax=Pseudomonas TaxID=286 RepID=UPI0024483B68|nr:MULTISPECIES: hypothetical protein [Pseudomonas]MDH0617481.1 hypothetical protein [Pseudomonas fulva]MDH1305312.1 hypothetical protein [Pseudomonas fulva]MDP9557047.1 hypothetical protein [Pseudomonas parafulva]